MQRFINSESHNSEVYNEEISCSESKMCIDVKIRIEYTTVMVFLFKGRCR
jgi:hypothetical protein